VIVAAPVTTLASRTCAATGQLDPLVKVPVLVSQRSVVALGDKVNDAVPLKVPYAPDWLMNDPAETWTFKLVEGYSVCATAKAPMA